MNKVKLLLAAKQRMEYYVDAVNGCGAIADAHSLPKKLWAFVF